MNDDLIFKSALLIGGLLLILAFAYRPSPANAYTCEYVRALHQQYGTAELRKLAKKHNVTAEQRRAAIECLRTKHQRVARGRGG